MNDFVTDIAREVFIIIDLMIAFGLVEAGCRWYREHNG